jgi:type I restriction-modification system DNA methylase subunit
MSQSATSISALIWSVADLLRGDYKPADYGKVILPFTVLRRLDCVLAPSKAAVLAEKSLRDAAGVRRKRGYTVASAVAAFSASTERSGATVIRQHKLSFHEFFNRSVVAMHRS